ncbi:PREDICTED: peptidoglycan recognition protein 4 isoform X4 [Capra hircus]|uniref:peptidoglycan recognition protein 4 isoform X4 n=1 Tax=Capra hircus TaxID=9925 RepID=UPI0008475CA4|nr:PREDICTED: peptidoglycan recognition protein 4 isoform X4 [Capra hircus]
MLWWLLVFSTLGLGAWGDSSWDKTQDKHLSKGLQDLLGNISQLIEKDKRGLSASWLGTTAGCTKVLAGMSKVCTPRATTISPWASPSLAAAENSATQARSRLPKDHSLPGHSPSPAALAAMEGLISSAVRKGHLSPLYVQPLLVKGESCLSSQQNASLKEVCPLIVQRSAWDAREAHCPEMNQPAQYVIIIHTAGRTCNRSDECRVLVQDIQSSFMDRLDSCDIGYNFLVGQDGIIYEGVGWSVQGSHTPSYNDIALGLAFMGTFSGSPPNAAALEAAKNLIQCSVIKGHLVSDYLLVGHSDVTNVLSPGRALYNVIKTWPHFRH